MAGGGWRLTWGSAARCPCRGGRARCRRGARATATGRRSAPPTRAPPRTTRPHRVRPHTCTHTHVTSPAHKTTTICYLCHVNSRVVTSRLRDLVLLQYLREGGEVLVAEPGAELAQRLRDRTDRLLNRVLNVKPRGIEADLGEDGTW